MRTTRKAEQVPTSRSSGRSDSFQLEFEAAGDRHEIVRLTELILGQLEALGLDQRSRSFVEVGRAEKKNYAQRLSTSIAQKVADALRHRFKTVLPTATGERQESRSMGAGGLKKLDVNYSTAEMGLGLGVSIKTINFKDEKTRRYTKNVKRVDGELRAEAQDYHRRQPYAVLIALIFMPVDACIDGSADKSSLWHAWEVFSARAKRKSPEDEHGRFERLWIGLYETDPGRIGEVHFIRAENPPPLHGAPIQTESFSEVLAEIITAFQTRNHK